ncbi:hypothetical protein L602_002100000950 [Cupriavidus gilardii J11]|uniref:Uncharacterized protein n=1 Tax=Cupriavidus gilardii J11 TaxID=936133 RepID=A0A562BM93_9BURK|nr:hypothetical protein L602_002100000950 [Cupriavidus gilardii J11]
MKTRSLARYQRPRGRSGSCGPSSRAHIIGVVVSDTTSDTRMATDSVMANSENSRPTMPPISSSGMKTAISDRLIEITVKPTSRAPRSAACTGRMPASIWREMFSSTTMASSTTKPVAMVSAISDRLFSEKPARYITVKVPISDTGTATLGISVARTLRRNRNTTMMTSATDSISVCSTSRSDARMVGVRSSTTSIEIEAGIIWRSDGSIALTRSTVSMMLAPGDRFSTSSTDGLPFAEPALRMSCTESVTVATSDSRTGTGKALGPLAAPLPPLALLTVVVVVPPAVTVVVVTPFTVVVRTVPPDVALDVLAISAPAVVVE